MSKKEKCACGCGEDLEEKTCGCSEGCTCGNDCHSSSQPQSSPHEQFSWHLSSSEQ